MLSHNKHSLYEEGCAVKKFIFRFPATKRNRYIGSLLIESAQNNMDTANRFCKNEDGTYTEQGSMLVQSANTLMNCAAEHLGFKDATEMIEYKERHGKI